MKLANKVLLNNTKPKEVITFPIDNIDTSWMTEAQKKFWEILKNDENKNKKYVVVSNYIIIIQYCPILYNKLNVYVITIITIISLVV